MKVAVILGGKSAERDVSLASGWQVLKALRERGHEAFAIEAGQGVIARDDEPRLLGRGIGTHWPDASEAGVSILRGGGFVGRLSAANADGVDVYFLAVHGGAGEDGTLQAILEAAGAPFTGSGFRGSAFAFDKDAAKRLFRAAGVPTPDWLMAPCSSGEVAVRLGWPVVVKPNKQGSTVGLSLVKTPRELGPAIDQALRRDDEAMVEAYIDGREFTVGVLEDRALAAGEIVCPADGIFGYAAKYRAGAAREIFPAPLSDAETNMARDLALRAHRACKLRDYSRVDFRMDRSGGFWCLEVNSLPGLTATSLFPQSAAAAGIGFPELCERICRLAVERRRSR